MTKKAEDVFARMEQLGVGTVREMIASGHWPTNYHALAKSWLRLKDVETIEQKPEHRADPVADAEKLNELACAAARAARDATSVARSAKDKISEFGRLGSGADATAREANSTARDAAGAAQSSITQAMERQESARFEKPPGGDDKRQERLDQPKWHNILWDKPGNKAILLLPVLAVMLLIFVLAVSTPPPASSAIQIAANSTDPTNSPSFDCVKTVDAVHKLICSTPQLAVADRDMAAAYEAAQTSPIDSALRNSQWDWLKSRDNAAADISVLAGLYKDRINFLLHYHHAVALRRPRKPILTNSDASVGTKTEEQMDSNPPHACTHEELVQARIARMNEYTGGPNCTNGP